MQEPYDLQSLVDGLKDRGLDVVEEVAVEVLEECLEWLEESAHLSDTPFDDVVLVVLPKIKEEILKLIDKLDGEVG
jgi:hypothetical protein